jgi:D-alanine-D-alanine ligase
MEITSQTKKQLGKIGVLMGGPSSEREISLKSGHAVHEAFLQLGLDAAEIDITSDDAGENIRLLKSKKIDCAFLALHGRYGEDGQIQEILEGLSIPYTGSGVQASKLAMDKELSRNIFQEHGLAVPRYKVFQENTFGAEWNNHLGLPLVVKPVTHGSSIGLSIIDRAEDLNKAVGMAFEFDKRVMIEEYIKGRELTVGILDEKPLPVIEIIPKKTFFDFEAKYQSGMTDYVVPAQIDALAAKKTQEAALAAHRLLGCYGCSRVDLILNHDTIPYVLEVNTIPGMTSTSLLPKAARCVGIDFPRLCVTLIRLAYEKRK